MDFGPAEGLTEQYNEQLFSIDKKICELLNQRKKISNNNSILPSEKVISSLADEYRFQEEYLQVLFATLEIENKFEPTVVPVEFRKYLPILKSIEHEGMMYTVSFIRQYANASMVYLYLDWDEPNKDTFDNSRSPDFFDLSIDDTYVCHSDGGGGIPGHMSYSYVVSPALPDDITGIELLFKESGGSFTEIPTGKGFEFSIELG